MKIKFIDLEDLFNDIVNMFKTETKKDNSMTSELKDYNNKMEFKMFSSKSGMNLYLIYDPTLQMNPDTINYDTYNNKIYIGGFVDDNKLNFDQQIYTNKIILIINKILGVDVPRYYINNLDLIEKDDIFSVLNFVMLSNTNKEEKEQIKLFIKDAIELLNTNENREETLIIEEDRITNNSYMWQLYVDQKIIIITRSNFQKLEQKVFYKNIDDRVQLKKDLKKCIINNGG